MPLNTELLNKIVATLKSDNSRPSEKRTRPRVGVRGKVKMTVLSERGIPIEVRDVWVRDISAVGIGLSYPKKIAAGTRFIIYIPHEDEQPLALTYRVANCRAFQKDLFAIGGKIEKSEPVN